MIEVRVLSYLAESYYVVCIHTVVVFYDVSISLLLFFIFSIPEHKATW